MDFDSISSITYVKEMPNLHTHSLVIHLGVVKFCGLRGEDKRGWEGRIKNGVRRKLMITF